MPGRTVYSHQEKIAISDEWIDYGSHYELIPFLEDSFSGGGQRNFSQYPYYD